MIKRLLFLVLVLGGGYWLITNYNFESVSDVTATIPEVVDRAEYQRIISEYILSLSAGGQEITITNTVIDGRDFSVSWTRVITADGSSNNFITTGSIVNDTVVDVTTYQE